MLYTEAGKVSGVRHRAWRRGTPVLTFRVQQHWQSDAVGSGKVRLGCAVCQRKFLRDKGASSYAPKWVDSAPLVCLPVDLNRVGLMSTPVLD